MSLILTLTLTPTLRNSSKQREKEINGELINEISYSFEISTLITKILSHKIDTFYIELVYKIQNVASIL